MPATTHTGGCHCGQIRYAVTLDISNVVTCNCSICTKKGTLLAFTTPDQFRLDSGEETLTDYQFNKRVIHHLFCPQCGVQAFARGRNKEGVEMVAVNVRCLDNVDLSALTLKPVDGRSF